MPAKRLDDQRCPSCGAFLIVMHFHDRVTYHCRTHGPFVLEEDGTLRQKGQPSTSSSGAERRGPLEFAACPS
jgi:hypothetical protein